MGRNRHRHPINLMRKDFLISRKSFIINTLTQSKQLTISLLCINPNIPILGAFWAPINSYGKKTQKISQKISPGYLVMKIGTTFFALIIFIAHFQIKRVCINCLTIIAYHRSKQDTDKKNRWISKIFSHFYKPQASRKVVVAASQNDHSANP